MIIQHFLRWKDSADVSRRKAAASALSRAYLNGELPFEEHCAAEAALTLLLDDPSEKVRYALAEVLCSSAYAPAQIINALIQDQFEIASLVIARSPLVQDRDLITHARTGEERLQVVIANRPHVSNLLAQAIAQHGCPLSLVTLLKNFNADVCGQCRGVIVSRHADVAAVRGALLKDRDLEPDLRLKVLKAAGEALTKAALFGKRKENGTSAAVIRDAEQRALVHMAGRTNGENADILIDALRDSGDLTTQLLIRTACHGKMDFLARVISSLSGQTTQRVTSILVNERSTQLKALLKGAGFSDAVAPVFENAIRYWRDVAQGRLSAGAQEITRLVMERFEEVAPDSHAAANDDILALLRSIYLDTMRDNARRHAVALAAA